MIKVFVCMPYGDHNDLGTRELHTMEAMSVWHELADNGFYPFCPHLSHFLHEHSNRDRIRWLAHALTWLSQCDCLLALGEPTEGMRQEIRHARSRNMPVFRTIKTLYQAYLS